LNNARAIACYRRLGFRECGTLRAHANFDGRWIDVVLMEAFLDPARIPSGGAAAHG
jgi:RimJ/RimL family protein N-acetyltransferase